MIYEIGELEDQYIDKYDQYRITLKSIRDIEGSVQPSRDRKQKITDEIAHLKYKDPQSPKIPVLEQELVRAEAESLVAEAQLSNITREQLKAAFNYQFDATRELAEKYALIAGYGKALLELLDDSAVTLVKLDQLMMVMKLLNKSSLMLKMLWLLGLWIPLLSNQLCLYIKNMMKMNLNTNTVKLMMLLKKNSTNTMKMLNTNNSIN